MMYVNKILALLLIIIVIIECFSNNNNNNNHNNNDNNNYENDNEYHRKTVTSQHTSYVNDFHIKQMFKKTIGGVVKNIPSVFVLGVQKGGSSSLYEFLIQHPSLCGGTDKDPHFFDFNYKKGRSHYESFYTDPKCDHHSSFYVDGSTMMHSMDSIAPRISSFYTLEERKALKFIVLLREPVSRDYSWYGHVLKRDLADGKRFDYVKTFKEIDEAAVRANSTTHRSGRYVTQLSQFTQYFDRNQILIINSQSLFLNSSLYMESIRNFLDLPRFKPWEGKFPKEEHIGYTSQLGLVDCVLKHIPALDCDFRDLLGEYYVPYNKDLDNWLAKTPNKSLAELPFDTFGEEHRKINCVKDARQEFQKILKKDRTLSCTSSK